MNCLANRVRRPELTCKHCGKSYRPKAPSRITFCSRECSYANLKANTKKPVVVQDRPCSECGAMFKPKNYPQKVCSVACRKRRDCRNGYKRLTPIRDTCLHCGGPMGKSRYIRLYCSLQCGRRASKKVITSSDRIRKRLEKQRRDHAEKGQERFHPNEIFERDGWRCQLCGKRVAKGKPVPDFHAPVMDHIVPISKGGEHSRQNVQCAHFICNSRRREVGYAQALLFG